MSIDYARAGDLLAAFGNGWETFDGDAWVALFTDDATYAFDPFEPPLTGQNEIRAYLVNSARTQEQVEFTVERHWVSGDTVLAAWHASFVRVASGARVRIAGFLTLEVASDGRVARFREWWHRREPDAADRSE